MKTRLAISYLGNIVDIVATLYCVSLGCEELNPIMAWLLQWPTMFVITKLALMTYVVCLMWFAPESRVINACSWISCILYGSIALYYILGLMYVMK